MIKCANGETIMLTHDCTLPRPYSRGGYLQGSKGLWEEDGRFIYLEDRTQPGPHGEHNFESDAALMDEFRHPLWKEYEEFGLRGGHGGMDYIMDYRLVYCLLNGLPLDMDVYDLAEWCSVIEFSRISLENGNRPVEVPDFTRGNWNKVKGYKHAFAE